VADDVVGEMSEYNFTSAVGCVHVLKSVVLRTVEFMIRTSTGLLVADLNPILTRVASSLLFVTSSLIVFPAAALCLYINVIEFLDLFHCGGTNESGGNGDRGAANPGTPPPLFSAIHTTPSKLSKME
jgi:hypothetical protein